MEHAKQEFVNHNNHSANILLLSIMCSFPAFIICLVTNNICNPKRIFSKNLNTEIKA